MPDFVVSGAGGFIGGYVVAALQTAGFSVEPYRDFRDADTRAATFVHCANIHASPVDNAAHTADVLAAVAPRINRFVQLQTFATLHGPGGLDRSRSNFGKTPLLMAPYGYGKLLQEQVLCRESARWPSLAVRLVYLPVVRGGGSWGRVLAQARRHGVVLPPMISAAARANQIDVGDIAGYLVDTRADVTPGIERTILNRADSASLTWPDFFRDAASITVDNSPAALVKRAVTCAGLAAYNIVNRLKAPNVPPGKPDRRPPRPAAAATEDQIPAEPVRFTGLIQHIVCRQPYIPAS